MEFETKIAVVLCDALAVWQKTNVTAFLVSGIAGTVPGVVGEPYRDASGNEYLPMFVQPVLVYEADDLRYWEAKNPVVDLRLLEGRAYFDAMHSIGESPIVEL